MDRPRYRHERRAWLAFLAPAALLSGAAFVLADIRDLCPPVTYDCNPATNQTCALPLIIFSCAAPGLIAILLILGGITLVAAYAYFRSRRYVPLG